MVTVRHRGATLNYTEVSWSKVSLRHSSKLYLHRKRHERKKKCQWQQCRLPRDNPQQPSLKPAPCQEETVEMSYSDPVKAAYEETVCARDTQRRRRAFVMSFQFGFLPSEGLGQGRARPHLIVLVASSFTNSACALLGPGPPHTATIIY